MTTPSPPTSPPPAEHDPGRGPGPARGLKTLRPRIPLPDVWRAAWITASPGVADPHAAPIFRRAWDLPSAVARATLHISGLGTVLAWVNGHPASEQRLAPGLTNASIAARAVSWDVTAQTAGSMRVCLAAELGRGFFDLHSPEVWMWSEAPWRAAPRLTAELHVTCEDGSAHVLPTDETWRCATGGLRFDSLYEGETWDEALEPHGWREPAFEDSEDSDDSEERENSEDSDSPDTQGTGRWAPVTVLAPDPGPSAALPRPRAAREIPTAGLPLREAMAEPILVQETLLPTWTDLGDGRFVGDLGRVVAGWTRLEPLTDERLEVTLVHGERLADDGSVIAENAFIPTGRFQRDDVALEGRPFESHHTYKGFRYVEVRGAVPGRDAEILGRAAWADVPLVGGTETSDPTLAWLEEAFVATVRANLHWVLTDTPTYEKNGWTGDAQVALPALLTRFDLRRFLTSWLDDFLDAQREDGSLPVIVPSAGWGYGDGQCAPAPEWTTLYPVLVDALEGEYGLDLWPIHGEAVEDYLDFELGRLDADGLAVGILGDYLSPGADGPPPEDVRLESSLLVHRALDVIARAGRSIHRERYARARDELAAHVLRVFFDAERSLFASAPLHGHLADDSAGASAPSVPGAPTDPGFRQTPQILALASGIVPAGHVDAVRAHLIEDIRARGDHHDAGCLGMAHLGGVLVQAGRADLALAVARNPAPPSWESWRLAGHRTLLEMWVEPVRSRAHYFMGAGVDFVARDLVGLHRTAQDWAAFELRPVLVPGIARLAIEHRGIRAGWEQGADEDQCDDADGTSDLHIPRSTVHLTVPDGSRALVHLPDGRRLEVGPGEHHWEL
ncbi:family 78 glycoside hydrolase catalytic domain [Brachybacterium sp. MASK1Z-5]|uniref:alpha-L-rhamnosidase n=1 Tax=Brachybacterium halotolerans TaxID=2795215 RepID=A0ABS1B8I9_9MICO|nr:family 78 glycoside hydrolase catalytic domain [Brachybacterium halotolerans]MBK0330969.1 family 78 glycoside hydrolase catalytic domain [Brachybacterium halotolerans]